MQNKNAIILLSGGMDSLVCTAIAKDMGYNLNALHINYKQRTEERELHSYNQICDYYQISSRLIVDISYLANIGASSLTDVNIEVTKADLENKEIPSSYVPFRNANILAIATSWAEVIKAESIIIGAVEEDSSGYPDTRSSFFSAFEKVISEGTKNEFSITIETPIIKLKKFEIVTKGIELNAPFELSWSCYKNNDIACGECDSCALRLRGFALASSRDPIQYSSNNER
jgi:7-cyano-7-deazaguanine synthase